MFNQQLAFARSPVDGHLWCFYYAADGVVPLVARHLSPEHRTLPPETVPLPTGMVRQITAAVDANGAPAVACQRWNNAPLHPRWELWCARRDSSGHWLAEQVDHTVRADGPLCLTLDSVGQPHLAYLDGPSHELRYALRQNEAWHCESLGCLSTASDVALTVEENVPRLLFLDANEYLVLAYGYPQEWHLEVVADLADPSIHNTLPHQQRRPPAVRPRQALPTSSSREV